jgi:hypothetical protein
MTEDIRIYEVENTNLLQVITNEEKDSTYYSKSNLDVYALNGRMVLLNNDVVILNVFPYEVLVPQEESVVDLVEIIQGYLNNIIPENQEEIDTLKDILATNKERNELLYYIQENTRILKSQIDIQNKTNNLLTLILS